ncbi:mRNA interferase HigB [Candidatus Magnetomoraceae bacterium gMMP-13]
MHVIARQILKDFSKKYPEAKAPLERWWTICRKNNFSSFSALKKTFGTADMVGICVIFNIGGGKYRLIARVNFSKGRMWIKYILPHEKYDKLNLKDDSKCKF